MTKFSLHITLYIKFIYNKSIKSTTSSLSIPLLFFLSFFFSIHHLSSQKVGLVLSGGGAPGIAHIGVIKALEENKIPIDYITGTSIGAVVGGLYAMAYSPNEIIQFFKSKDFNQWSNGETTPSEIYYFKISDAKPCLFEINYPIKKDKLLNWKTDWIPSSLLSPHDMNYAFVPLSAQANAIVAGDFDTLFVPFRCVASDVYNKRAYVFRNGQLSNAIRASMTFPFAIKPIEIENHLLFDGGIYNNFPVDIMQADFQPDYIIGSVVAYNPPKADKQDVLMQLQNMIIHNTEYSIPADNGLLLNFDLKKYDTFDFTKVDELVQIGYDSVMAHLDEIKAKISVRISTNEIDERRAKFRSRFPELTFQDMKISGVDSIQEKYLLRLFGHKKTFFGLEDFKKGYCKLISDDRVTEVVPQAIYDSTTQKFHLKLDIEAHDQLKVSVGGNLSTSNANQLYVGLKYQNLNKIPTTISIDAQTGEIYSGIEIGTRIEIPSWTNMFLKLSADIHKSDYYTVIKVFFENSNPTFSQYETVGKLVFGLPMGMNSIICLGTGYGLLTDIYSRDRFLENQTIGNDKSSYSIGKVFAKVEGNILNNAMYPTNGQYFTTSIQLFKDNEKFVSNNNSTSNVKSDLWLQFSGKHEQYFSLSSYFSLGTYAELVYSTHNLLENYTSTLIQATAFQPTTFTRTIFNETFRSNQFVAIGIKPIYNFNGNLHLRSELYWFLPYQTINNAANQAPYYSYGFNGSRLLWESALVYNFTKASAGFYVNYSTGKWNVGLNVGILLPKLRCTD